MAVGTTGGYHVSTRMLLVHMCVRRCDRCMVLSSEVAAVMCALFCSGLLRIVQHFHVPSSRFVQLHHVIRAHV